MEMKSATTTVFLGLCAHLCVAAMPAPVVKPRPKTAAIENDPFYQTGMSVYAAGMPDKSLDFFSEALRRHPNDPVALSAVSRVKTELAAAPAPEFARPEAEPSFIQAFSDTFDAFVLVDVARALNFDDTLGDGESRVGTLAALSGRVAQLFQEQRFAREHDRPFPKERELRALVRRMPAIVA